MERSMWLRRVVYGERRASAALVTGPARSRPYGCEATTSRAAGVGPALFFRRRIGGTEACDEASCLGYRERKRPDMSEDASRTYADEDGDLLQTYTRDGSEEAFAAIVRRHRGLVQALCLRHAWGDRTLAEDAAQQVFILLARKAGSMRTMNGSLAGWLAKTARLTTFSAHRSRMRRRRHEELYARECKAENPEHGARAKAFCAARAARVRQALARLPPTLRDPTSMRYFDACSYAEVGRRLDISATAARRRVHRARRRLRLRLVGLHSSP